MSKVLPGMQSAFIDLGLERDGFLYVSDVIDTLEEFERLEGDDEDEAGGTNGAGNGSKGRPRARSRGRPQPKIEELLKEGQEIIVQVAKEPLGTKGARLTSHATMPGRFLVFMPTVDHVGVSRKIESREERSRLRGIVREFREQHGFTGGVIIRTAAAGRPKEDIVADLEPSTRSGPRSGRTRRRARRRWFTRSRASSRKLLRDLLTEDFRRSASTTRRSTSACWSSSSGSCRSWRRKVKLYTRSIRSSRSTASRPKSTRR